MQLQKRLREITLTCACVANVSGCRDAVTYWLSLGKGRGTIPLKSVTDIEEATVGF